MDDRFYDLKLISDNIYSNIPKTSLKASTYELEKENFECALKMIDLSFKYGVSPIRVNQGAWYFASMIVGDKGRLIYLISNKSISLLDNELSLIKDVL